MNMMPHILHVIDSLAPGGAERMVVEIANATDKQRYRVSVCVTRAKSSLALRPALAANVPVHILPRRFRFDLPAFWEFSALCRREQVHLLHVHNRPSFRFVAVLKAFGCLPSVPVVFLDQYGDVEMNPRLPLDLQWAVQFVKPYWVGVHPDLTSVAVRVGVTPKDTFVITNAIDFACFDCVPETPLEDILGPAHSTPVGIIIANVRPQKDYVSLLHALAQVKDLSWHLLAVGGFSDLAYYQTCLGLMYALGLEERITFLGPRLDVPTLLKAADFAVLSSRSESGPLVLLEYAAAGLPFVSTQVGLIGDSLARLGIPEFVPPQDVHELARALRRLLALSPGERKERGMKTRELAAPYFDIRNVMPKWYQLYERALEGSTL
ncbi:MAG: glycosyltransferase [Synergistales bacterium]|nr:glycosyltransferase [Synergistales bacterium]